MVIATAYIHTNLRGYGKDRSQNRMAGLSLDILLILIRVIITTIPQLRFDNITRRMIREYQPARTFTEVCPA
jgi:hypothetical protein